MDQEVINVTMMDKVMTRTLVLKLGEEASDLGVDVEVGAVDDASAAAVPTLPDVWWVLRPRVPVAAVPDPGVAVVDEERVDGVPEETEPVGFC